jgi:hypothetical protein
MGEFAVFIHLCRCLHGRIAHDEMAYECFTIGCHCKKYRAIPNPDNEILLEKIYSEEYE